MENLIICKAGMKKQKGILFGITILLFLSALLIAAVLVVSVEGGSYIRREIKRAGFGDITAWVSKVPDIGALTDSIRSQDEIEKVKVQNLIFSEYEGNNTESDSEGQLIPWEGQDKRYHFFNDEFNGYRKPPKEIEEGTVYVSPSMISIMDLKRGDKITFPVARGGSSMSFTVAGYYEDPFMGSSMIGMKGFLISKGDYDLLVQSMKETGMDSLVRQGAMIHMDVKQSGEGSISETIRHLNKNTSISQYTEFIHSEDAIYGFMSILQSAFCGLLAAFALILLIAAMVVSGHSMTGMIEQETKNLGILKTIGFTGNRLVLLYLIQYLLCMAAGILLGIGAAYGAVRVIGKMTITTTGVLLPSALPMVPCLLVFSAILLLLTGFAFLKLRKIRFAAPMRAIRKEEAEGNSKQIKAFRLKREGLTFRLAVRQLLSGKKRYVSACIIAVLLVFFASLAGRMNDWLGPEGKGMMDAFNPADLDIGVQTIGEQNPKEVEEMVRSYTRIKDSYLLAMPNVSVNGSNYTANVITEPDRFHISKGQTSKKEDEVVLTEVAASDLGADIGDKVNIRGDMGSREFTVSGIYHCANNMGANIGMNKEGYLTIGKDAKNLWCYHYFLEDVSAKGAITEGLEAAYGGDVHVHENSWSGLYGIISAMHGLLAFMYGMIAAFVLIVTIMTGSRILTAERRDLGIYESIGCPVSMLRMTFALRFGMAAVIGALAGTILAALFTDPLVSSLMRFAGISNFASHPNIFNKVIPGVTVILLFFGFSYLAAGRIKKSDWTILIAD